ncbi:MAG: hypothetical protein GXO88_04480 [Chlorobi bacterium]|nr:hypothetical protein [Chlorobiota bacterium]
MARFNRIGNYKLVVMSGKTYVGLVSQTDALKAYRKKLLLEETDEKGDLICGN